MVDPGWEDKPPLSNKVSGVIFGIMLVTVVILLILFAILNPWGAN